MKKHRLDQEENLLKVLTTCAKNGHTVAVSTLYEKVKKKAFWSSNWKSIANQMVKFDHINFFSNLLSYLEQASFEDIEYWARMSASHGSLRCLKLFLDLLAKRNELSLIGKPLFFQSFGFGQQKVVDLILDYILDPNLVDHNGMSVLYLFKEGQDYTVECVDLEDPLSIKGESKKKITIVDWKNTGRL